MKNLLGIILAVLVIVGVAVALVASCGRQHEGTNEIGEFKEVLKLITLKVSYEDVYQFPRFIDGDSVVFVYWVKGDGEYTFDLEKVEVDTALPKKTIIRLPRPDIVSGLKDYDLIYPHYKKDLDEFRGGVYQNLYDSINKYIDKEEYQIEAGRQARNLLKKFFKEKKDTLEVVMYDPVDGSMINIEESKK